MNHFGLIGKPVSHSLSPIMMNKAFEVLDYRGIYIAAEVDEPELERAVRGLYALHFLGTNVTIPHKQNVMKFVDVLTPEAKFVGAVNTLKFDRQMNCIIGHNTDVSGWWAGVEKSLLTPPRQVAVLGCGGGARAVVGALVQYASDASVTVIARDDRRSRDFVKDFKEYLCIDAVSWDRRHEVIAHADLVVNTTPIGMWPNDSESPVTDSGCFQSGQVVQDIVYRPLMTKFLEMARESGAVTVDGLSMLIYQGALALEFWTGQSAPVHEMRLELMRHFRET